MNYILLPSLQHAAVVKTTSLLYKECEIQNLIRNEAENYRRQKKLIEGKMDEKLSSLLPPFLRKRVAEVVYHMLDEVKWWEKDHQFLLEGIGGCCCPYLRWMTDGTINRIQTSKEMVANENINPKIRFIIACTYFLEDDVIDLWEKYEEILSSPIAEGENIAVRFWIEWLMKKDTKHWTDVIDEYFRDHRSCPKDIPSSVSRFYHLLSRQSKQHIDLFDDTVHTVDFRMCVNKMIEKERIEVFRSSAAMALILGFRWPFRCLFIRMAKEAIDFVTAVQFVNLLQWMIQVYFLEGDEDFHILESFWEIIPASLKKKAILNKSTIMLIGECLESETVHEDFKKLLLTMFDWEN